METQRKQRIGNLTATGKDSSFEAVESGTLDPGGNLPFPVHHHRCMHT